MESGSDKRRPGVMSRSPCPCFLPSGLQMEEKCPALLSVFLSSRTDLLWVFHPLFYFSAWPPDLCRILWFFWWRAVKSTRHLLLIHSEMEKRERGRWGESTALPFSQLTEFNPYRGDSQHVLYKATCCIVSPFYRLYFMFLSTSLLCPQSEKILSSEDVTFCLLVWSIFLNRRPMISHSPVQAVQWLVKRLKLSNWSKLNN